MSKPGFSRSSLGKKRDSDTHSASASLLAKGESPGRRTTSGGYPATSNASKFQPGTSGLSGGGFGSSVTRGLGQASSSGYSRALNSGGLKQPPPSALRSSGLGGTSSGSEYMRPGASNYAARANASSAANSASGPTLLAGGGSKHALSSFRGGPVKATAIDSTRGENSGGSGPLVAKSASSTVL